MSTATVSNALNGTGRLSEATRQRVLAAVPLRQNRGPSVRRWSGTVCGRTAGRAGPCC
ncbi:LacI family DNA-binding transcriptional regulator [Streptomyces mirabilis]